MDYIGTCFYMLSDILDSVWGWFSSLMNSITPLGVSLVASLAIMFIVFRYIIAPFLR